METQHDSYYLAPPSHWPIVGSIALMLLAFGFVMHLNHVPDANPVMLAGAAVLLIMLFGWFGTVIKESEGGKYNEQVDLSYRWSMSWFIFSEVMFFGAFFTALWWGRAHSLPELGNTENALLWEGFVGLWPSTAQGMIAGSTGSPTGTVEAFTAMVPIAPAAVWAQGVFQGIWGSLPTINTLLLLTSGVTLTVAHHALLKDERSKTIKFMWLTVVLGIVFLLLQGYEYYHAYHAMNLKMSSGIYGSTFFLLTGFHGFHVFLGMMMLLFVTLRLQSGHFNAKRHFGFEGAAWYGPFVDVVWLLLYVLVYWL